MAYLLPFVANVTNGLLCTNVHGLTRDIGCKRVRCIDNSSDAPIIDELPHFLRCECTGKHGTSFQRSNVAAQALYESLGWKRDDVFLAYSRTLGG